MDSSNAEQQKIEQQDSLIKNKKSHCFLFTITFIIALGALIASISSLFLQHQLQNNLAVKNIGYLTHLDQLKQLHTQNLNHINSTLNDMEKAQAYYKNQLIDLNKHLDNVLNQKYYNNQDWLLLKARYYLELAQINAHWSESNEATIALLEQADVLIKSINTPKIFIIRQAIAKDIAKIQALPLIDVTGLLSQLDAAQNNIDGLSIRLPENNVALTKNNQISSTTAPSWQIQFENSINFMKKLIVIRHHDKPIEPPISPEMETMIKENLHINLQEAQSAVLTHNNAIYQMSLKHAITTIKKYFTENKPDAAALIKKLSQMQQVDIVLKKIDISSALQLLNEFIDERKNSTRPISREQGGNTP